MSLQDPYLLCAGLCASVSPSVSGKAYAVPAIVTLSACPQIVRYFRPEAIKPMVARASAAQWPLASADELHSATRISQLFGGGNVSKAQPAQSFEEHRDSDLNKKMRR